MYPKTKIATAAADYPVTLTEAKAHLRVDYTNDDTLITTLILAATDYAEKRLGRALITQTWDIYFDNWSDALSNDSDGDGDDIELPYAPLQSVSYIKYYDTNNTLQTISSSDYYVDTIEEPGCIRHAQNSSGWPGVYYRPNAINIRYVCGYGASSTYVPETIRAAIKLLISHFYENREGTYIDRTVNEIPIPKAIEDLFGMYSINHTF